MFIASRILLAFILLGLALPAKVDAATTTWRVAMVIYRGTDVVCNDVHVVSRLSDAEWDSAIRTAQSFDQQVSLYSNGMGDVELTFIYRDTLTTISDGGSYCWPRPVDVTNNGGWPTGFDSVHVQYDARGLNPYFGLAFTCGACSNGSTYSTNMVPAGPNYWFWNGDLNDADVITHEWMHDANAWHRKFGRKVPDPHQDGSGLYAWTGGWNDALLSGDVTEIATGEMVGWTASTWAAGTPTGGTVTPPPTVAPATPKPCKNPASNAKQCRGTSP